MGMPTPRERTMKLRMNFLCTWRRAGVKCALLVLLVAMLVAAGISLPHVVVRFEEARGWRMLTEIQQSVRRGDLEVAAGNPDGVGELLDIVA